MTLMVVETWSTCGWEVVVAAKCVGRRRWRRLRRVVLVCGEAIVGGAVVGGGAPRCGTLGGALADVGGVAVGVGDMCSVVMASVVVMGSGTPCMVVGGRAGLRTRRFVAVSYVSGAGASPCASVATLRHGASGGTSVVVFGASSAWCSGFWLVGSVAVNNTTRSLSAAT